MSDDLEDVAQLVREAGLATGHATDCRELVLAVLSDVYELRARIAELERETDDWRANSKEMNITSQDLIEAWGCAIREAANRGNLICDELERRDKRIWEMEAEIRRLREFGHQESDDDA